MDSSQGLSSLESRKQTLKPIETRRSTERKVQGKTEIGELTGEEEPLSPVARLFRSPQFSCCIVAILGCKTEIKTNVVKMGLEQTLLKHPRFASIVVVNDKKDGDMKWVPTKVNLENHIIIPKLDPNMSSSDQFVEDYIAQLTQTPMDLSKPLWEFHILNVKTSDANSVTVFRIHHSIGDGTSLISLLLACTRKSSDPEALPTIPTKKKTGGPSDISRGKWWLFLAIWSALTLICNTCIDVMLFVATLLFLSDTQTPLKGTSGVADSPKRFVRLTVSLDDIKLVKNAMNVTINDVLLGVTQAGMSRYLNRKYSGKNGKDNGAMEKKNNLPKNIRLRAALVFNMRPSAGIEALANMMKKGSKVKWGNSKIGYALLPFNIALRDDPLDYVRRAKAIVDRKKHSLEAYFTFPCTGLILKFFGVKAAFSLSRKAFSNTTLCFSNLVGPVEEISFYGHPVAYIAPTIYGLPHALTVHFQSYVNKMTIVMAIDQVVIPDPHQFSRDLEESLQLIKNAVVEREG